MCTMKDFFGVMGKRGYIYIVWARTQSYGDLWKRGPLSIFRLISFYHIFLYFIIPALFLIAFNIQYFVFNKCLQALLNKTSICKNFISFKEECHVYLVYYERGGGVSQIMWSLYYQDHNYPCKLFDIFIYLSIILFLQFKKVKSFQIINII